MPLFMINRYEDRESSRESGSRALTAKLQEQVKAREQQSVSDRADEDEDHQQGDKEQKKRKHEELETEVMQRKTKSEKCQKNRSYKESDNEKSAEITETSEKAENSPCQTTFHILGGFEEKTVQKVKRVLPQWLAQPDVIQRDVKKNLIPISEVPGICPTLLKKLETNGILNCISWRAEETSFKNRMIDGMHYSSVFMSVCLYVSLSPPQIPLQKLWFSATLTHNPEKLPLLDLHQPRLFSSTHSCAESTTQSQDAFNFPQGLVEYYVPCTLSKKTLIILHFLLRLKFSPALCFTNSREAAALLYLLVKLFVGVEVAEFSSKLSTKKKSRKLLVGLYSVCNEILLIFRLISTDAAARGIDIHGVKCVINYDAAQNIRTYIHRQMVRDAGSPGIQRHFVQPEALKSMETVNCKLLYRVW
uniref:ATP-dependent RNA helicase n=1 Tax=Sinocyclocheilus anshuiensis TaxID=1608454 RepID=A0A671T4F0_9TELE